MKAPTVKAEWESFERVVLPAGVSAVQRTETRRAFYAGCRSLFVLLTCTVGDDSVSEDAGEEMMKAVDAELKAFSRDVAEGRA